MSRKYEYEVIFNPGKSLSASACENLVNSMLEVAKDCFDEVPYYQALTGRKDDLDRAVICLAWDTRMGARKLMGFCSAFNLEVEGLKSVLHLGLTCVSQKARGKGLTHKLTSKLLMNYMLRRSPFQKTWVTNCACVISSLANVALYFEDVYPSPLNNNKPSKQHQQIASIVSKKYRQAIAINETSSFDDKNFIFRESITGSVFVKDSKDKRFHHRDLGMTRYYQSILNFENGDEVLQVGSFSLMTFPKYMSSKSMKKNYNGL